MADPPVTPRSTEDLHAWQARRVQAWGRLLLSIILAAMGLVLGRVVQLKIAPDPRLVGSIGSAFSARAEPGRRGSLLDRRGRPVAMTSLGYRLFLDPSVLEDPATIGMDLEHAIGADAVDVDRRLMARPGSRYVVIDDRLEGWQVDAVRGAAIRGVGLELRPVRHYPHGGLAAGLVGMVGFEHTGLSGLEHRFESRLRARPGRAVFLRDAELETLWIDPDDYEPPRNGGPLRLSVDLAIQSVAQDVVDRTVARYNAGGGRLIVLDCRTGEVLALYDRLNPRAGWAEQTDDPVRARHPALGRNRCVTDPYEPGSTFKPFIWAVATELGRADPDEVLDTPEEPAHRTTYGRRIRDSHYHGPSTWRDVLVHSMNSGMAIVGERMSHGEAQSAISGFGFGAATGCGLPGESVGIVTSARKWSDYTQSSVAMGHEIAVTPMQMVRAFSVFARDGTMPTPRLTALEDGAERDHVIRRVVSPETAKLTRTIMRHVMLEGTGQRARSSLYPLFGKSGTAQLPKREGGGYHEDRYVSSFIAGAPLDEPRVVVLCVIDDPDRKLGHWGGAIAGPAVREVVDRTLLYLGVEPVDEEEDSPQG